MPRHRVERDLEGAGVFWLRGAVKGEAGSVCGRGKTSGQL